MPWIEQLQGANWSQGGWLLFCAYLLGCFTTGYYLIRVRTGQDIHDIGSGNVGARNVGRVLGSTGFLATLAGDFSKGAGAVWLTRHFSHDDRLIALSMILVVVGHIWPIQLRFRGGKGVATSMGALLIYDFHLAVAYAVIFACFFAVLRRTVLPGIFAFVCLPLVSMYFGNESSRVIGLSVLAGIVFIAHRKNLFAEFVHLGGRGDLDPKPNRNKI
jgi:Predicted membrane protein